MFFGLWINGTLACVIRHDHAGYPTLFDFNVSINTDWNYEIDEVVVRRA